MVGWGKVSSLSLKLLIPGANPVRSGAEKTLGFLLFLPPHRGSGRNITGIAQGQLQSFPVQVLEEKKRKRKTRKRKKEKANIR